MATACCGEDLVLKLRLVQSLDGQVIAARRTISTLKASIGEKDARPLDGTFQLKLGTDPENPSVNTTAKISQDAASQTIGNRISLGWLM